MLLLLLNKEYMREYNIYLFLLLKLTGINRSIFTNIILYSIKDKFLPFELFEMLILRIFVLLEMIKE